MKTLKKLETVRKEPPRSTGPELSDETFALFQQLILREMGIRMRGSKKILVANRLRRRLAALKLASYEQYFRYLTRSEQAADELPNFVGAISTNETYFYRGDNQFPALREEVLPRLLASPGRRAQAPVHLERRQLQRRGALHDLHGGRGSGPGPALGRGAGHHGHGHQPGDDRRGDAGRVLRPQLPGHAGPLPGGLFRRAGRRALPDPGAGQGPRAVPGAQPAPRRARRERTST